MHRVGRYVNLALVCLCIAALLPACGSKVDLKLKLEPGMTRVITVTNDLKISAGPTPNQTQQSTQELRYEVESVGADGIATVKVTTNLPNMDMMSGAMGGMAPGANPLADIGEIALSVQLGPDGKVHSVSGMDPVVEKAIAAMKEAVKEQLKDLPPEAMAAMGGGSLDGMIDKIAGGVKGQMGDEAMKSQLQNLTDFYPEGPVGKGDSWTRETTMSSPFPMKASTVYTVSAQGSGVTNIEYTSTFSPSANGGMDLGVMKMKMEISGQQTGTMQVDNATGWITAANGTIAIDGKMKMGPMDMPLKVEGTVYIASSSG
jgi:uncharacterized protein DUF6263